MMRDGGCDRCMDALRVERPHLVSLTFVDVLVPHGHSKGVLRRGRRHVATDDRGDRRDPLTRRICCAAHFM
jgi:hypothetical protein